MRYILYFTTLSISFWLLVTPLTVRGHSVAEIDHHPETTRAKAQEKPPPFNPDFGYDTVRKELPYPSFSLENPDWNAIAGWVNLFFGSLFVAALIITGILFITSGGDPEQTKRARANFVWVITGIVIYALIFFILWAIRSVLTTIFP